MHSNNYRILIFYANGAGLYNQYVLIADKIINSLEFIQ
jgi:hypothetical protein